MEHKILEVTVKMSVPVMVEDTTPHDTLDEFLKHELESSLMATVHSLTLHAVAPGVAEAVEPSAEPEPEVHEEQ